MAKAQSPVSNICIMDDWLGLSLKTSPLSNWRMNDESLRVAARPRLTSKDRHRNAVGISAQVAATVLRAPVNHRPRWPRALELAVEAFFGAGITSVVPRGRVFDRMVIDREAPSQGKIKEFCVVGIDLSRLPGELRYHCWEPTGVHDCTMSAAEVEKRMAIERFGRSVALRPRPSEVAQGVGELCGEVPVVRWSGGLTSEGLVRELPEVDACGTPVLSPTSRFAPRNSGQLLSPLLQRWLRLCAEAEKGRGLNLDAPLDRHVLILDCAGRAATRVLQESKVWAQSGVRVSVVAADHDGAAKSRPVLNTVPGSFTDGILEHPVSRGDIDIQGPTLKYPDCFFHTVIVPFAFRRLSGGVESHFLALLRESLRVSTSFVLVAEDMDCDVSSKTRDNGCATPDPGSSGGDIRVGIEARREASSMLDRVKMALRTNFLATVLVDGELPGSHVPDHFLSLGSSGTACHSEEPQPRRFLILKPR